MTTRVLVKEYLIPIVLMSVFFMLLMPYGTFKPTELGFYLSIICAIFIVVVTKALLNRFQVKKKGQVGTRCL